METAPHSKASGTVQLVENDFWDNERNLARYDAETEGMVSVPLPEGNRDEQPQFVDETQKNFALSPDSPLAEAGIGARDFAPGRPNLAAAAGRGADGRPHHGSTVLDSAARQRSGCALNRPRSSASAVTVSYAVEKSRVRSLEVDFNETAAICERLGRDSATLLAGVTWEGAG